MKIFICASKHNYSHIPDVKTALEQMWHIITLPNSYDNPGMETSIRQKSKEEHIKWKQEMLNLQSEKVSENDAILVMNFDKNWMKNYIWWATFLEVYEAFIQWKKIFFYNPLPEWILYDELAGINPAVINWDLNLIK